ncbi:MAG: right-handed parallel beta-helix repeat-containing protein [Thermoguttaceae bacterium]|nr:right-handed parallel beta-helix repeat-containing protein [Thermoguttaceae bacterium]
MSSKLTVKCFCLIWMAMASVCWATDFYVSPFGNDAWSGKLPEANKTKSDGPKRTLHGAQVAWRQALASEKPAAITVFLRGGTWNVEKTLELTAEDRAVPLSIQGYQEEKVVLLGSRPLSKLRQSSDGLLEGPVDFEKGTDPFVPGRVFSSDAALIRARFPNYDPNDQFRGGFLFVDSGYQTSGLFGGSVGNLHNVGDTLIYSIDVVEEGAYTVWTYYGGDNARYNIKALDARMSFQYNDEKPLPMMDAENTGSWATSRWSRSTVLNLKKGKGTLTWRNNKGGGISLGGFILSADPHWTPVGQKEISWEGNSKLIAVAADSFVKAIGPQISCSSSGSKDGFRFLPGELKPEWVVPGVELKIFQSGSCRAYQEIAGLVSIKQQGKAHIVRLNGKELTGTLGRGDRYYLENHPSFLDGPGEWYFDHGTGKIRIIPPTENTGDYRYATLGTLVQISEKQGEKAAPVRITNVQFGETAFTRDEGCVGYGMGRNGVIQLQNASNVTVENCRFFNIGRYAVSMTGGKANRVSRVVVCRSAQGGVLVADSSDNIVADCDMRYLGSEYKHIGGVILTGANASRNLVEHNYISDSSRYGISMKSAGTENRILYNDVRNTSLETYDTGAIEVTQPDKTFQSHTIIANNRVISTNGRYTSGDQGRTEVAMSWGIYLDSFAGGYLVENNYVYDSAYGGFMLQGGQGNTVRNNIFRNGSKYQGYFANYLKNFANIVFEKNVLAWTNPNANFYIAGSGITSDVFTCRNNLYSLPADMCQQTKTAYDLWAKRGLDLGSVAGDAMFVHPDRHDGLLKPESPAFKLGFKQLDLSTVGPRK